MIAKGEGWELRLGRWQDVLGDVEADALVVDAPYSERTHSGHAQAVDGHKGCRADNADRRHIDYEPWTDADVDSLIDWTEDHVEGWHVSITDHALAPRFAGVTELYARYVFAPLPFVAPGSRVRLGGDGPSCWTTWLVVSRPRKEPWSKWGTLPGAYILPKGYKEPGAFVGGKPLWLMRALVRDYSRPGDLIVDPCAGSGTTLLAAAIEGRRAIGAEMDPATFELAVKRLKRGYTPAMDFGGDQ